MSALFVHNRAKDWEQYEAAVAQLASVLVQQHRSLVDSFDALDVKNEGILSADALQGALARVPGGAVAAERVVRTWAALQACDPAELQVSLQEFLALLGSRAPRPVEPAAAPALSVSSGESLCEGTLPVRRASFVTRHVPCH